VTLARIMAACSVSKTTASGWRSGRHVPAIRHWHALAGLAGVGLDELLEEATGVLPSHTPEAQPARSVANAGQIAEAPATKAVGQ
jgi:transcriptional regulator with XRE-family HTH domain